MRWTRILCLLMVLIQAGCGRRLEGVYECRPEMPRIVLPGGGPGLPQLQDQMDEALRNAEKLQRMTLEFRGTKARFGNAGATVEYSYNLSGNRLELTGNLSGQGITIPMEVREDGSIEYLGLVFRRVR